MPRMHRERHRTERIGWLRAAVLGANDGIVSTASLVIGVAAASAARGDVLIAGVAGLVAGAMSMAAGEYVSVKSQSDTEAADLARERGRTRSRCRRRASGTRRHLRQARAGCGIGRPGRDAADGARCVGRPRTRRTRHLRDPERATGAGGAFVGGELHSRARRLPLLVALDGADGGSLSGGGRRQFPGVSRNAGRGSRDAPAAPRRSRERGESRSGAPSQWPSPPLSAPCSGRRWPEARDRSRTGAALQDARPCRSRARTATAGCGVSGTRRAAPGRRDCRSAGRRSRLRGPC